ncbi:hypothetical protein [Auraticoccus monumenti]|uniref:EcsC protein family protein n=1 Tax=Auraticoccus monumenti TaxID=675864 RepID=A0A1G6U4H8_9ACTN|nr:hypothetical protein [Auraticoccus monumenti]SDD36124.1 EcsC protein family protein [Auraticoccus monumenti]
MGQASAGGGSTDVVTAKMRELVRTVVRHGIGPLSASRPWAEERRQRSGGDVEAAVSTVVNESATAAATTGFVTGLGGLLTLPVALPANVAGSLAMNARMVGGLAHLRGHDLEDEHNLELVEVVVLGGGGPQRLIGELGKRSGVRLAASVLRAVPVIGGLANGAADAGLTVALSRSALQAFPRR